MNKVCSALEVDFNMIRKLETQEEKEKREARNKRAISIVLAIVMLLSTAGYFVFEGFGERENILSFSNVEFRQTDYGTWSFSYGGNSYETMYNPKEVVNVSFSDDFEKTVSDYYDLPLYISSEPIEEIPELAATEILRNLGKIASRSNYACLSENCSQNYPVKNCSIDNIIIFKQSNKSSIKGNEKCAVIEYVSGEQEKAADAFLFSIMNIV